MGYITGHFFSLFLQLAEPPLYTVPLPSEQALAFHSLLVLFHKHNTTAMKMILFRSTFVSASTMLQTIALLCIFLSITSVSAVPQYGRPSFHVLDEPIPSRLAVPLVADSSQGPSSVASTPSATANVNSTAESTHTSTPTAVAQTSGASHSLSVGLGGVPVALIFSAAASAAWLVF